MKASNGLLKQSCRTADGKCPHLLNNGLSEVFASFSSPCATLIQRFLCSMQGNAGRIRHTVSCPHRKGRSRRSGCHHDNLVRT